MVKLKSKTDFETMKEELMALQLQFELDEISEKEYDEKEQELLDRLDAITKSKER